MKRQVTCEQGVLEGLAVPDPIITAFRGVPFAQPPVGALRWRAPQPPKAWQGVREAYDTAPACFQPTPGDSNEFYDHEWGLDPAIALSEDCLYANIWTPALRGTESDTKLIHEGLPVMVWIHGGAYQCGGNYEKEFDGSALASKGVVVVSVAYRLNAFGFFTHNALRDEARAEDDDAPFANFGLLDQQAGISWVKRNIDRFGGNPENITVFGQSAGAASVLAQICAPSNRGLFSHAIMQSGCGLGYFNKHLLNWNEAAENGVRLWDELGVDSLEQARSIPAERILEAAERLPGPHSGSDADGWAMPLNWSPCVDGVFLPKAERRLIAERQSNDVDVLLGDNDDEFLEVRDSQASDNVGREGNLVFIDAWVRARYRNPYYYQFGVKMPGDDSGAFHSADLWFVFGTQQMSWRPWQGCHMELSRTMMRYWVNFARHGNPNGEGLPVWKPSDGKHVETMRFQC